MSKKCFYSFHYDQDNWRAGQVRNIGVVEGNEPVSDHAWEDVKRRGDTGIQQWIDTKLADRECTIVLIGSHTAKRKWIDYEIHQSWNSGKGLFGIHIHNLIDMSQNQSLMGANPFEHISMQNGGTLDQFATVYNPPHSESRAVYAYIAENIAAWVDRAIRARQ